MGLLKGFPDGWVFLNRADQPYVTLRIDGEIAVGDIRHQCPRFTGDELEDGVLFEGPYASIWASNQFLPVDAADLSDQLQMLPGNQKTGLGENVAIGGCADQQLQPDRQR